MPLLQTWGQYSSYMDENNFYRFIWQWSHDGSIEFFKVVGFKTEAELETYTQGIKLERDYAEYTKLESFWTEDEALIVTAVTYIRTHPALTLNQWNTYLNAKAWYEKEIIKQFIWKLANKLAEHYGLILANYTETEVLLKVRNWICTININILKKVVFGYLIEL